MKSNSAAAAPPLGTWIAALCVAVSALAVGWTRPRIADEFHRLRKTTDGYALPSPEQTIVASLGYRAALADLIFANVLVSYGLHIQERRRYEFVGEYLDTVNALDPTFRDPFRFADTLLTLQGVEVREQDYRRAREILERGLEAHPYDADLWRNTGQFMAYLAWDKMPDAERAEWRGTGAKYLARSCELLGDDPSLPYHCITAASLFNRLGQHEAMIEFLQRVQIISDNPEIAKMAEKYLDLHLSGREKERAAERLKRFHGAWGNDFKFVSRNALLVIGPEFDPTACAGTDHLKAPECATSWKDWHHRREHARK